MPIWLLILISCLLSLKISFKYSIVQREKKGQVSGMRFLRVSFGSWMAAPLATADSVLAEFAKLSRGLG